MYFLSLSLSLSLSLFLSLSPSCSPLSLFLSLLLCLSHSLSLCLCLYPPFVHILIRLFLHQFNRRCLISLNRYLRFKEDTKTATVGGPKSAPEVITMPHDRMYGIFKNVSQYIGYVSCGRDADKLRTLWHYRYYLS
jgi:hypothetical protein